jgi:hypothetical protein
MFEIFGGAIHVTSGTTAEVFMIPGDFELVFSFGWRFENQQVSLDYPSSQKQKLPKKIKKILAKH